jgi:hypothetical protein
VQEESSKPSSLDKSKAKKKEKEDLEMAQKLVDF